MLNSLITSKTRVKLLLKFFLNSSIKSYLRNLEQEFGESSNAIRVELNRLENAELLCSENIGNRKYFSANTNHPMFSDINNMVKNYVGINRLVEELIGKIENLEKAFITGDIAVGINSRIIELLLIGQGMDVDQIDKLISRTEKIIDRKISYLVLDSDNVNVLTENKPLLIIWEKEKQQSKFK